MPLPPFRADLPVRVRFGEGAIAGLPALIRELGAGRPVALADAAVAGLPAVSAALGPMPVIVRPAGEPTLDQVDAVRAQVERHEPDLIVAIGGGSTLDAGKAVRAVAGTDVEFGELLAGRRPVQPPAIPLIAVPTTSGTGSEVSGGCVMADPSTGRKSGVASPLLRATAAVVDPLLTLPLPAAMTAATGADALAQAIGAVTVRNGSPLSAALGLEACRLLAGSLAAAVHDGGDRAARTRMSLASLTAGLAMNLSDCGADHALGHASAAVLHLPHGLAVGITLAEALDVTRRTAPAQLERVADALGEPPGGEGDGRRAVTAVRRLLAAAGLPSAAAAGMRAEHVEAMAALALADYCLSVDAHAWNAADVRAAYAAAITGGGCTPETPSR